MLVFSMSKAIVLLGLGIGSIKSLQVYQAGAPHRAPVRFSVHGVVNSRCVEMLSPGTFAVLLLEPKVELSR